MEAAPSCPFTERLAVFLALPRPSAITILLDSALPSASSGAWGCKELVQTVRRTPPVQVPVSIAPAQSLSYCVIESQFWNQDGAISGGALFCLPQSPFLILDEEPGAQRILVSRPYREMDDQDPNISCVLEAMSTFTLRVRYTVNVAMCCPVWLCI